VSTTLTRAAQSKTLRPCESTVEALAITQYIIPFKVPGDQRSRKALHHFCTQTALDLSGNSFTEFWQTFVLQRCQHEAVVRQAVVALSSLHFDYIVADEVANTGTLTAPVSASLQQYDKAVYKLRKYIDSTEHPSHAVVLICCVCFISLELLRGGVTAAASHLQSGMSILRVWEKEVSDEACEADFATLTEMFGVLDIQACMFDDTRPPAMRAPSSPETSNLSGGGYSYPKRFCSISEAQAAVRDALGENLAYFIDNTPYNIVNYVPYPMRPQLSVPNTALRAKRRMESLLSSWEDALDAFVVEEGESCARKSELEKRRFEAAIAEMRLRHRVLCLLVARSLGGAPSEGSPNWSSRGESFDAHAEQLLAWARCAADFQARPQGTTRRCFSVSIGIMTPLFLLALETAHSSIREQAVALMLDARLSEGFCNPIYLVQVIRHLEFNQNQDCERLSKGHEVDGSMPLAQYVEQSGRFIPGEATGLAT